MQQQWARIEGWLRQHLPQVHASLRRAATPADLAALEAQCGVPLPADYAAFLAVHDGQRPQAEIGMFYGMEFLCARQAAAELRDGAGLLDAATLAELAADCSSIPPGAIRHDYQNQRWLPFASDGCGNFLGLDGDPGPCGTPGQVITMGRDEACKRVVAGGFGAFVEWLVRDWEQGNARIGRGAHEGLFCTRRPRVETLLEALHFLCRKGPLG